MLKTRHQRIKEKYLEDQAHIKYLMEQGWHPLDIADQMTHNMLELLREGIHQQHPELSGHEIILEMRKRLSTYKKQQHRK